MICVDELRPCNQYPGWPHSKSCHLFSDDADLPALHHFASALGLSRAWFQHHPRLPHYDLTQSKRRYAVNIGAKEVDRRYLISIISDSLL